MQIPKKLLDLIGQGAAFTITVNDFDGTTVSYKSKPANSVSPRKMQELKKTEGELNEAFRRFNSMPESERIAQGVWKHALGIAVVTTGKFVKTFAAELYKARTVSCYVGKGRSMRCHVIPRPPAILARDMPKDTTQDPPNWPDLPPFQSESQHAEQHATGCPLASPASPIASDPGPRPEVASD